MIPATSPLHVTVAEAPRRIGKSLFWCPVGSPDGVWHDSAIPGEWREPDVLGLGKKATLYSKYDYYRLTGENSVAFRAALRRDLIGVERRALIMGELSESVSLSEDRNSWKTLLPLPRNRKVFSDTPRAWLTLDCDDLDLRVHSRNADVLEMDGELPDVIADVLDQSGLDWLIADCVMHFSSRHGLLDRHTLKAHIEWHLEKPLTLAEQKRIADYANRKTAEAGYGKIFDLSIYAPEHLIFTAPTLLQKRIWKPGEGIVCVPVNGLAIERVRHVVRGQGSVQVPDEAVAPSAAEKIVKVTLGSRKAPSRTSLKITKSDSAIEPGNVYNAIRAHVYAAALKTPSHLAEAKLEALHNYLVEKVAELPDNDAAKLERRLRYASPAELRRSWDTAIAKRRPWLDAPALPERAKHTPAAARQIIQKATAAFVVDAVRRLEGRQASVQSDTDLIQPDAPKPLHLLMRAPPGIGKTQASLASILPTHLTTQRISYLAPTVRLSEEAISRKLNTLDGDYLRTRARHHKGRKQLCKSEEYGKLAERLEELGRSPIKDVCWRCPMKDACAWPAQHDDKESGLVAGQHAHATTSLAKLGVDSEGAPSFGIIDESLIGTLLSETQKTRSIAALKRASKKTVIRGKDGSIINSLTTDLHAYRDELISSLSLAKGKLSTASVLGFASLITITRKDGGSRQAQRIDDAVDMEHAAMRHYDRAFRAALSAYHEARQSSQSTNSAERRMSSASQQLKLCGWYLDAYRAIKASLNAKRDYVFGFTISATRVSLHLRAPLPTPIRTRSWVWLDGTANEAIWQSLFHGTDAELQILDIPVQPGAYHLTQYPDRPYGKGMFLTSSSTAGKDNNLRRLHRFIAHTAARHSPHQVLVVCQKQVREALSQLPLPRNVALEHFNNIRGVDAYKTARAAIIVGRPLPTTTATEAMTEALHYDNPNVQTVAHVPQWSRTNRILQTSTGAISIRAEVHPDPQVELLRQQVVDAEVRQAINRLRLYDRTQDNQAEIHVFGQVDTGLTIHALADWQDAERENAEILYATGIYSDNTNLTRRLAGGLLSAFDDRWVREVVSGNRINARLATLSILGPQGRGRSNSDSRSNRAFIRLACANIGEWSVKVEGLPYAVHVWVNADRHGTSPAEVQAAIEAETELKVLSLWPGPGPHPRQREMAAHGGGRGGLLDGRHHGSRGSLSRAVDPVSVRYSRKSDGG